MHSSRSATIAHLGRAVARALLCALLAALWALPPAVPIPRGPSLAPISRQAPAALAAKRPVVAVAQAEATRPSKDKPWPSGCFTATDCVLDLGCGSPDASPTISLDARAAQSRAANRPRAPPFLTLQA